MARMSWHEACQLDESLASLDSFFSVAPKYACTLTGGLTNRCWKIVLDDGNAYVWRPATPITQAFSISRTQEFQILTAIETSGIAPKPIYINGHGLLVEWIEGRSLTQGLSFESLLKSLTHIHQLPITRVPVAPFNYTARVDHYWIRLEARYKTPVYQALYNKWRTAPNLTQVDSTLCHFDLAGYNMVDTTVGNRVIDWEYACVADPRLDLALCIDTAQENPYEAVPRYCQMRNLMALDDWIEGVKAWQPRATMMAMLWYLLAHQLWGDDQYLTQAQQLADAL